MNIWKILGIKETKDKKEIRKAYAHKLKTIDQDKEIEKIAELRSAYQMALFLSNCITNTCIEADTIFSDSLINIESTNNNSTNKIDDIDSQDVNKKYIVIHNNKKEMLIDSDLYSDIAESVTNHISILTKKSLEEYKIFLDDLFSSNKIINIEYKQNYEKRLVSEMLNNIEKISNQKVLLTKNFFNWDLSPIIPKDEFEFQLQKLLLRVERKATVQPEYVLKKQSNNWSWLIFPFIFLLLNMLKNCFN